MFAREVGLLLLLHFADECGVFFEELAVFGVDHALDFLEVFREVVENRAEDLLVFHSAVELGEQPVGVVDRSDRLVCASNT